MSKATKRKHVTKEVLEDYYIPEGDEEIVKVIMILSGGVILPHLIIENFIEQDTHLYIFYGQKLTHMYLLKRQNPTLIHTRMIIYGNPPWVLLLLGLQVFKKIF